MAALWLASFPDGWVRSPYSDKASRPRMVLPPAPALREKLRQAGLDETRLLSTLQNMRWGDSAHDTYGTGTTADCKRGPAVTALVKVVPDKHQSNLVVWDEEVTLQRILYSFPLDCYSLQVTDVRACVTIHTLSHKKGRRIGEGGLAKVTGTQPLFTGHWGVQDADQTFADVDGNKSRPPLDIPLCRSGNPPPVGQPLRPSDTVPAVSVLRAWGFPGLNLEITEASGLTSILLDKMQHKALFLAATASPLPNIRTKKKRFLCSALWTLPTGDPADVPVLVLPWPIVYLVMKRRWSSLLLLARWHTQFNLAFTGQVQKGPVPDFPPAYSSVWQHGVLRCHAHPSTLASHEEQPDFSSTACFGMLDHIRLWAEKAMSDMRGLVLPKPQPSPLSPHPNTHLHSKRMRGYDSIGLLGAN